MVCVVIFCNPFYRPVSEYCSLTRQFADKPTRGQSSRGLVNWWTSQLAQSEIFLNHGKITLYMHAKPKPNTNLNPID